MALMLRYFLSLIIYVYTWIPTVPTTHWTTHTLCVQQVSVFHQPSSFTFFGDRQGNLPWECGLCATMWVETSVISLRKLFNTFSSRGPPHLVVWDLTIQIGGLPVSYCMFLSPWVWVLFPQEEEEVRWEGKIVIHIQVKKPVCTLRLTATSTTNTKARECSDNTVFCFPWF